MSLTKKLLLTLGLMAASVSAQAQDLNTMDFVTIETNKGPVVIELYEDVAPKHVESFRTLISKGFYDGLKWHRVVPGFVVQGGDPKGDGTGGPGYTIDAEFSDLPHKRGAVSAARTMDPNSAGSQFYIVLDENNARHLDGQYTIFGQVIDGMDNVDELSQGDEMTKLTMHESNPAE